MINFLSVKRLVSQIICTEVIQENVFALRRYKLKDLGMKFHNNGGQWGSGINVGFGLGSNLALSVFSTRKWV